MSIAGEEALIVWDAASHTEHFVRRAHFESDATDFGFLVPTPSPPELAEADDSVFDRLRTTLEPEVKSGDPTYTPTTLCLFPFQIVLAGRGAEPSMQVAAAAPLVEVLSTARVAGMDATVLRASDADALTAWLDARGYATRPALTAWLAPYVARGFAITAFRYVKSDASTNELGSEAVRLTFRTDTPFYPYREPSDQPESFGRTLRLFFVADSRHEGQLDDGTPWSAHTEYAAPLPSGVLSNAVPHADATRSGLVLTSLVDTASHRAPHDSGFVPSDAGEVRPPPTILPGEEIPLPIPIELFALGGGIWWWRHRRRASRTADRP